MESNTFRNRHSRHPPRLIAVNFRPEEQMDKRLKKASLSNDEIVLQGSEYKGSYIPVRIETRARPAVSLP